MSDRRTFRASEIGKCNLALASPGAPEEIDPVRMEYLRDGHRLQEGVENIIINYMDIESILWAESWSSDHLAPSEVIYSCPHFRITGHPDMIISIDSLPYVVEIKAISDEMFKKLKTEPWHKLYPRYYAQAQAYLRIDHKPTIHGLFMFFKNRSTGEIIGGIRRELEGYTFDNTMAIFKNSTWWEDQIDRLTDIVIRPEAQVDCDSVGYCFDCKGFGRTIQPLTVIVDEPSAVERDIATQWAELKRDFSDTIEDAKILMKKGIRPLFKKYKAPVVEIGGIKLVNPGRKNIITVLK